MLYKLVNCETEYNAKRYCPCPYTVQSTHILLKNKSDFAIFTSLPRGIERKK